MMRIALPEIRFRDDPTGAPIVRGLELDLEPGKVLGLFGPNGAGKTTILRYLLGTEPERFLRDDGARGLPHGLPIGYVPQNAAESVMPWLDALDNIALPHVLQAVPRREARARVQGVAKELLRGIPLARQAALLSGGEKQLVVLARELARAPRPALLMIDEGCTSMDYARRFRAMAWLRDWCRGSETAILSIAHDAEEVALFSDLAVVLSPRPSTSVARIEIRGPSSRGLHSLGERWLADATQSIQGAFLQALTLDRPSSRELADGP